MRQARIGRGAARGLRVAVALGLAAGGLALAGPAAAQQQPLCETGSVSRRQTDFAPVPVPIKQFPPSLGTLTSVSVERAINSDQVTNVESREETAKTYVMKATVTVSITSPAFTGQLPTLSTTSTATIDLAPFDGTVDFDGPSGESGVIAVAPAASDSQSSTDPTTLANFTGDGTVTFSVDSVGDATFSGPGNADYQVSTFAQADVRVCYTFQPPPTTTTATTSTTVAVTAASTVAPTTQPATTVPQQATSAAQQSTVPQSTLAITGNAEREGAAGAAIALVCLGGLVLLLSRATRRS
jgi:hypothetical protein